MSKKRIYFLSRPYQITPKLRPCPMWSLLSSYWNESNNAHFLCSACVFNLLQYKEYYPLSLIPRYPSVVMATADDVTSSNTCATRTDRWWLMIHGSPMTARNTQSTKLLVTKLTRVKTPPPLPPPPQISTPTPQHHLLKHRPETTARRLWNRRLPQSENFCLLSNLER